MRYLIILLIFSVYFTGCDSSEPKPPDKPPGYQEDIPWPSLADSPWPRDHGDAQSTGRSKYPGLASGSVAWTLDSVSHNCGISIAADNSIYLSTFNTFGFVAGLFKVSQNGEILWYFDTGRTISNLSTPLITSDGTIIASSGYGSEMFAFSPDGTLKWRLKLDNRMAQRGINIGKDGTIYTVDWNQKLYAISQTGNVLWTLLLEENIPHPYATHAGSAFSPDGNLLYIREDKQ